MNRYGAPPSKLQWLSINQDVFDGFRVSFSPAEYELVHLKTPDKAITENKRCNFDPIQNFNLGITRDPNIFPTLKDPKN